MGLSHDRYEEKEEESDLRRALRPYSFGYVNRPGLRRNADSRRRWITIMAYHTQCSDQGVRCSLVMRFSNPNQRMHGDRLGVPGTTRVARVNGPADARRTLNATRRTVANFRQGRTERGPDLVVQSPRVSRGSLRRGQAFTFSANVHNRGDRAAAATTLRYQRAPASGSNWTGVGRDAVRGLRAGASAGEAIRLNAPSSDGTYRYRACVTRVAGETGHEQQLLPRGADNRRRGRRQQLHQQPGNRVRHRHPQRVLDRAMSVCALLGWRVRPVLHRIHSLTTCAWRSTWRHPQWIPGLPCMTARGLARTSFLLTTTAAMGLTRSSATEMWREPGR